MNELKAQIVELGKRRDEYVAREGEAAAEGDGTLHEALTKSVREQAMKHDSRPARAARRVAS